jgi:hypothetical protein
MGVGTVDGSLVGHAWVMLDGRPVHEDTEAISGFAPVVEFGAGGRSKQRQPAAADRLPRHWR